MLLAPEMHARLTICFLLFSACLYAQQTEETNPSTHYISWELLFGKTMPSNSNFPETDPQKGLFLSLGKYQNNNPQEWAYRLNYPRTGVSLGFTDYGNGKNVGYSITAIPYVEFDIFRKEKKDMHLAIGLGGSYFNKSFDSITNPFNRAISTKFTWAFKMFFYYDIIEAEKIDWRLGGGYIHNSNGHTRLPNQGFNSFVLSASAMIKYNNRTVQIQDSVQKPVFKRTTQSYFSVRTGLGQNALSEIFNDRKEVYCVAVSYGKIINKTYKFGGGIFYRFYENYYDYIQNDEALIVEEYPHFKEKPFAYASNYGLFGSAELLLNHVGFEFQLGLNISKPFYQIDWKLNQGYQYDNISENGDTQTVVVLGELDSYYELKRTISSRIALRYYLIGTNQNPVHNIYLEAALNANLGQADFTEINLGYVYGFNFKSEK